MQALEQFSPYLTGPVLKGTAGPYAEIELQLFPESVERGGDLSCSTGALPTRLPRPGVFPAIECTPSACFP